MLCREHRIIKGKALMCEKLVMSVVKPVIS